MDSEEVSDQESISSHDGIAGEPKDSSVRPDNDAVDDREMQVAPETFVEEEETKASPGLG